MWSTRRLPQTLQTTTFARRIDQITGRLGDERLDLTVSDPTSDFVDHRRRMADHLGEATDRLAANAYAPEPAGLPQTRRAIADYYTERGRRLEVDDIIVSASTSEAYSWLAKLVADPGGEVLIPTPSYPLFEHLLGLESVAAAPYPLRFDGRWHTDANALRERVARLDRPAALFYVSPNNPTGHSLDRREFEELAAICREYDLPLVVDEVFLDFHLGEEPAESALSLAAGADATPPLLVVLSGLSKSAGLPGAKLGWMALAGEADRLDEARRRLRYIADTFLSASTVTQLAAPPILAGLDPFHRAVRDRLRTNRRAAADAFDQLPACDLYPVEAGWYQVARLPRFVDEEAFCVDLLDNRGVHVQPGFFYELEPNGHLVFSLLTRPETFREGLSRLVEAIAEHL